MDAIYKYRLAIGETTSIPRGGGRLADDIVHVAMQGSNLCAWVLHRGLSGDGAVQGDKTFELFVAGTGWSLPERTYMPIGSVQDGPFVWHVLQDVSYVFDALDAAESVLDELDDLEPAP